MEEQTDQEAYFAWQSKIGEFGGWANRFKFEPAVSPEDVVLDFGCGGGYLLKDLTCQHRIGIEPNPAAAEVARQNGIQIFPKTSDLETASIDVVISNHALEHTQHPLQELQELYRVLKPGGTMVMVVPCESSLVRFHSQDRNHHLYSWNPMALGNLILEAGFTLQESKALYHRWPPGYRLLRKTGSTLFHFTCRLYGLLCSGTAQVRAVALKPSLESKTL